MKKQLILSAVSCLTVATLASTMAFAESQGWSAFKSDIKKTNQSVVNSYKNLGNDYKNSAENKVKAQKKAKYDSVKAQKKAAIEKIDNKIDAKKKQISNIKKSALSDAEKKRRANYYEKELKILESKKDSVVKTYNNQLDALKY